MARPEHLPEHIRKHISTIAEQEKQFQAQQTPIERLGHVIGGFVGSLGFVLFHIIWFSVWILLNAVPSHWAISFDPFPFPLLAILIEIEGIFLASFILMRQKRMSRRSDEREHLMLQVLLLAEQEITTLIDIERRKSLRQGDMSIAHDPDVESLSRPTAVEDLTRTLQEQVPLED